MEWFKPQHRAGGTYVDPINLPSLPPGKSAIDVAADYLFKLRGATRAHLRKTLGEVFNREEHNIHYFLTVPAIWNDAAKAGTRAAAIQAGFLRDENDNRLTLITEPEAAAMYCSKTGLLNLKVHDVVLIVDCGGGTVDLIAFEVEEEVPFTVTECTAASGDSCGSTALNRNFSNILRAKIRKMKLPDGSKTAEKVYAKCIMDFENRIKADFRNNGQKWAVDVGIEMDYPDADIEEGFMMFTNEEILQCFEPVVSRILELVRNQIMAIQAQYRLLQNVLVIGGFGASEYLFQQIKLHVPPPHIQSEVVRPMDPIAAVAKGAVMAGIMCVLSTQLRNMPNFPRTPQFAMQGGFGAFSQQIKLNVPPRFRSKTVRPMDSLAAIAKGATTADITRAPPTQLLNIHGTSQVTMQREDMEDGPAKLIGSEDAEGFEPQKQPQLIVGIDFVSFSLEIKGRTSSDSRLWVGVLLTISGDRVRLLAVLLLHLQRIKRQMWTSSRNGLGLVISQNSR